MTDWKAVISADYAVPADVDRPTLVDELVLALGSPDPELRDKQAYRVLATWIRRGELDAELPALGDRMAEALRDDRIQTRTFAVLILASAVLRDTSANVLDSALVLRWRDAFVRWYAAETDLRGWDDDLGWLHAVAHGSDLIEALGKSPRLVPSDLVGLLELGATRLLTPTGYVFASEEDDRLAAGLGFVLLRPELTPAQAVGWLAAVEKAFEARDSSTVPAWLSNTVRTLRALYVLADRGIRDYQDGAWTRPVAIPHRDQLKDRLAKVLQLVEPSTG